MAKGIDAVCPVCRKSYREGYEQDVTLLPKYWWDDPCPGPKGDCTSCAWEQGLEDRARAEGVTVPE